jgi:hypothetical protein
VQSCPRASLPPYSMPSPSNLRSPQDKIPASRTEGRKSGPHAEDGRFLPAAGLRLTICENRLIGSSIHRLGTELVLNGPMVRWPDRRGSSTRCSRCADLKVGATSASERGAVTHRDVQNEDRSGYVYENTGDADKMSDEKTGFYTKMHLLHDKRQQSVGLLCRECIGYAIKRNGRRQTVDHRQETEYKRLLAARRSLKGKPTSADVAPTFRSALDGQNNIADLKVAATKGFEMPECIRNKRCYR